MILCFINPCGEEVCPYIFSDWEPPDCEECKMNEPKDEPQTEREGE